MFRTYLKSFVFALTVAAPVGSTAENRIDVQRPDAPELAAYGKFEIGVRQVDIVNKGQIDILAPDTGGQAISRVIGQLNGFIRCAEGGHGQHRSENFFPRDSG